MKIPFNTLAPLYQKHKEEYDEAALRVLSSGWYVLGREVEAFESSFADFVGRRWCIGLNSGLDALVIALRALDIGRGDEVIVQANTYIATVLAITENDATPIFVEPDEFHCIHPEGLEKAITARTKAILPVHLYGQPSNMAAISEIAEKYGIPIVEDCAQSHGATWQGKMTGSFGSLGCFSFFPTKNLGAFGDAGAIVTDDPILAEKIKMLRNYGSRKKYYNEVCGFNSRLDELQAALLQVRLGHIKEILEERACIASYYLSHLKNPSVMLPRLRAESKHVWHLFVVESQNRDALQHYLEKQGIQTQIHYPVPPHLSEAYDHLGYGPGSYPRTEHLASTILSLPLYNGMAEEETAFVCEAVNSYEEVAR